MDVAVRREMCLQIGCNQHALPDSIKKAIGADLKAYREKLEEASAPTLKMFKTIFML